MKYVNKIITLQLAFIKLKKFSENFFKLESLKIL